jgi:ubiquinone/menaquinone biosynthesis C-methylase UbiE
MTTADYRGKAAAYARYRWKYADAALRALAAAIGLPAEATIADIGAGPAPLARWFAAAGFRRVYAVEPDAGMRAVAVETLHGFANAVNCAGSAGQSGLPDCSVDLLIAGRALHWFDFTPTLAEFQRISRPGAFLATAAVQTTSPTVDEAVRTIITDPRFVVPEHARTSRPDVSLSDYCRPAGRITIQVEHTVSEDAEAFFQRLLTFSGTPLPGTAPYQLMRETALTAFTHLADGPLLSIPLVTEIRAARLR